MSAARDAFVGSMYARMLAPALASAVGLALSDMADALVVGRRMGETGLAAIGMSLPLYMVLNVCMHGLGAGGSVRHAKLLSEGRVEEAACSFNRVMRAALAVSAAIALAVNLFPDWALRLLGTESGDGQLYSATKDYVRVIALGAPLFFLSYILGYYLRSDDRARLASAGMLAGNAIDIALNMVFVVALDWGTAGAAWATLAGLAVTIACYASALISGSPALRLSFRRMSPGVKQVAGLFVAGFSTSSQYLWQMAFLLIANNVLMAHLGGQGVAVFDMVQNASYIMIYLYDAAARALQPLSSTLSGEKNPAAARQACALALTSGLAVGLVAIFAVAAFPEAVCAAFGLTEADTVRTAVRALRAYCAGASFAGASIVLESYYQSVEQEKCAFAIALLRGCVVLIPAALLMGVFAPEAFWYVFPVAEVASLAAFMLWKRVRHASAPELAAERIFSRAIRSRTDDIGALTEDIGGFCERFGASARQKYFVTMAAEEISLAIMDGGFVGREDGLIQLTLIALETGAFELHIRDNATSFDPFSLDTPRVGEGDFDMSAMGVMVIKQRAESFFYRRYQGFNTMVVRI